MNIDIKNTKLIELTEDEVSNTDGGVIAPIAIVGVCFAGLGLALTLTYYAGYAIGKLTKD
jgi:lactobin A/cerein 7B family class IIb bacteriocin